MYVPGAITPLSLRSLYFARNSGPPDIAALGCPVLLLGIIIDFFEEY